MSRAERIAFVCPRFSEAGTVGGAETLLRALADRLAGMGRSVTFLTTCARNHFTWANEIPAGERTVGGLSVRFFPVNETRDVGEFLRVQTAISRRAPVTEADEAIWIENSVNSSALEEYLQTRAGSFDRIVMGPYLFGLVLRAARIAPAKTVLVPCLHDEPFAYLATVRRLFAESGRVMFNTEPERDLAIRLFRAPPERCAVVGMGLDEFDPDPESFRRERRLRAPYVIYSGRREVLKGTPLLLDYMSAFRSRTGRDVDVVLTGSGSVEIPDGLAGHALDAGFVSEADKRSAMAGAVAFIHPSVNESLSIVLLESWMAGAPALVHAGSAVMQHQCRRSGGGLWFRHYAEFEEELSVMLDRPDLRSALGRQGREFVRREYAWPRIDARLSAALDD